MATAKKKTVPAKRRWLVLAVRDHAIENYEAGGWDVIVECWEDYDIYEVVKNCRTEKGAIKKIAELVGIYADYQADARNSAF